MAPVIWFVLGPHAEKNNTEEDSKNIDESMSVIIEKMIDNPSNIKNAVENIIGDQNGVDGNDNDKKEASYDWKLDMLQKMKKSF